MQSTILTLALIAALWSLTISAQAGAVNTEEANWDKSGTIGSRKDELGSQSSLKRHFASRVSTDTERQGFEPWRGLHPYRFSRPAHSATLSPLQEERKC